ncbi:MAG: M13 family metallopeptidase [Verrucomicrobiota bacterium]|nr:M13 family metallopeptidase [Verrucomicrobiota bacterium]
MRSIPLATIALVALLSSSHGATTEKKSAPATADNYLDQFVDRSVSPREDFFHFAVGKWLKAHPIPPSEKAWGIDRVVQDETYNRLLSVNQVAAKTKDAPAGSNQQKIGDFWSAGMDIATNAQQGFKPIAAEFDRIADVKDLQGLLATIARLHYIGVEAMFSPYILQDEKNSDRDVLHLYQGGLGLPNRDYYLDTEKRAIMLRAEYVKHVTRMFQLLGDDATHAKANADTVMALETDLARASRKLEDLRDPVANYNAMSLDSVGELAPSIRWREFLEQGHISDIDTVVVGQPEFFRQVEASLKAQSLEAWKTYLRWQLAHTFAEEAGGRFDDENFHFFGTVLNGTPKQRPRFKRVLDEEEHYLGDALGQLYVERYFSPQTKERYAKLTDEIFATMRDHIGALDWMSDPTKERALRKLAAIAKKVGYPEHWRDYSSYPVDRTSFLMNCVRGNIWRSEYAIAKLHKPVDRTEWNMTPQTYNAYYNPSNNEMVLPAAVFILPGIDDAQVDDAIVYGYAAGTTIGHELTHGFDDEGRQFDERGNLQDWWTKEDAAEFVKRTAGIVQQFNQYIAVDTLHVNGSATQGENAADLGGITLAWDAFTKTDEYKNGKSIGGFTPAQRYFIGWALGWMNQIRPENIAVQVKTNVHSPSFLRVTGPVSNMVPFYDAFGVKPGDKMYRADDVRVKIW